MKVVYGTVWINGEKKRRLVVINEKQCSLCGKQYQPVKQKSVMCPSCHGVKGQGKYVETIDGKRKWLVLEPRKCKKCGNDFEPKRQDSEYCSRRCNKIASNEKAPDYKEKARIRAKEWYAKNRERANEHRKKYYWSNPEKAREATKKWARENAEKSKARRSVYKDKIRHAGIRAQIIEEANGLCSVCGKDTLVGWRDAVVHHANFDSQDHSNQVLVCRSCHIKIHKQPL